jgi:alpha-1,6-mannosyl-glycoprotein beta-1,2-N-acetylglucosaminyltransferase
MCFEIARDETLSFLGSNEVLSNDTYEQHQHPLSLREQIKMHNNRQLILNEERYGPVRKETFIITIQVHNRIAYLRHLIESLKRARDIDKALLIFSHDVYDAEINELIRSIDFSMVLQIFYPFSIQMYPTEFPGTDSNDCPRDIKKAAAIDINCTNAYTPDTYGHYREAKFTQMKHHWWWKLNRIFDELRVTRELINIRLLLLEEDHYVSEDFLYVYRRMQKIVPFECPKCNIITLGTYDEELDDSTYNKIEISPWTTNVHNMGMALNRTTWRAVKACAEHFCTYDEYNYDFGLQNINRKCLKNKLFTALMLGPRVYHTGECGVHHTHKNCDVDNKISEINENLSVAKRQKLLYPEDLEMGSIDLKHPFLTLVNNGGWSDRRDHCLCLQITWRRVEAKCHGVLTLPDDL